MVFSTKAMKNLLRKIQWFFQGMPTVTYDGANCGCCGKWIDKKITLPSCAFFWGWDLCKECENGK